MLREPASALLIASAKLVERLGGRRRRRGAGRCRLEIRDADAEKCIHYMREEGYFIALSLACAAQ